MLHWNVWKWGDSFDWQLLGWIGQRASAQGIGDLFDDWLQPRPFLMTSPSLQLPEDFIWALKTQFTASSPFPTAFLSFCLLHLSQGNYGWLGSQSSKLFFFKKRRSYLQTERKMQLTLKLMEGFNKCYLFKVCTHVNKMCLILNENICTYYNFH